jgi:hypothetical protein
MASPGWHGIIEHSHPQREWTIDVLAESGDFTTRVAFEVAGVASDTRWQHCRRPKSQKELISVPSQQGANRYFPRSIFLRTLENT